MIQQTLENLGLPWEWALPVMIVVACTIAAAVAYILARWLKARH